MSVQRLQRAVALHHRHEQESNLPALRQSARLLREVVADTDTADPPYAVAAAILGAVLRDLGIATRDDGLQDEAVTWLQVALDHADAPALRRGLENDLGVALRDRYDRRAGLPDLDLAVVLLRRSAESADPAQRARALNNLGLALSLRHRRGGDLSYLDEAVRVHRQAAATVPGQHRERPRYLNDLASALRIRAGYDADEELLDEAIALHEQAAAALPSGAAFRRVCLHDLFTALSLRRDVDRLVEIDRQLRATFVRTGMAPDAAELDRRVGVALRRDGLADADLANAVDDLLQAIDLVADGTPERAQLRANLADCLRLQHERQLAGVTPDVVTGAYRAACRDGLRAGADSAAAAAVRWATWAERRSDPAAWADAAEAYEYALEALHRMLTLQLGDARRQVRLRQLGRVPAGAALAGIRAATDRAAERAVTMLERGRAISLSEAIDLDRSRLADLAATGHDELASRFHSVLALLHEHSGSA